MPFRCRQKYSSAASFIPEEYEEEFNKNGKLIKTTKKVNKKLPTSDMFDLGKMLEAGVDIEEVNSKVMSTKSVNAENVVRKYTKKSTKSENNEVNE